MIKRKNIIGYVAAWLLGTAAALQAVPVDTGYIEWTQPDSTTFIGRAFGDEFTMDFETLNGYKFVNDLYDGYSYYAVLDQRGEFTRSPARVGRNDPQAFGIVPGLQRSSERLAAIEAERIRQGYQGRPALSQEAAGKILAGSANSWTSPCTLDVALITFLDATTQQGGYDYHLHDQPYGYKMEDFRRMLYGGYEGESAFTGNMTLSNGEVLPEVFGSLRSYYDQVSRGDFTLHIRILNNSTGDGYPVWVPLPDTKAHYAEIENRTANKAIF